MALLELSRDLYKMSRQSEWREEISNLSKEDLSDELTRPTGDWENDVLRETLRRILNS